MVRTDSVSTSYSPAGDIVESVKRYVAALHQISVLAGNGIVLWDRIEITLDVETQETRGDDQTNIVAYAAYILVAPVIYQEESHA